MLCLALAGSGCMRKSEVPAGLEGAGALSNAPMVGDTLPCSLLAREEAELALNARLGTPSQDARPILYGMKTCSLSSGNPAEEEKYSVVSWGVLSESASIRFRAYKSVHGPNIESADLDGHEAAWDAKLGTLVVLVGKRAVGIRLVVSQPPAPRRDQHSYARRMAELLAKRGLSRLDANMDSV